MADLRVDPDDGILRQVYHDTTTRLLRLGEGGMAMSPRRAVIAAPPDGVAPVHDAGL